MEGREDERDFGFCKKCWLPRASLFGGACRGDVAVVRGPGAVATGLGVSLLTRGMSAET